MLEQVAEPVSASAQTLSPFAEASTSNGIKAEQILETEGPAQPTAEQVRADALTERAARIISLASLLLLFVAVALYTSLSVFGWNPYVAAIALFCAGIAGYPLLSLLTHAVASQTSRAFQSLSPYNRFQWAQKMPSMLHATTMSVTGFHIVLQAHRGGYGLLHGRNELVAAFLGLELAYLVQDTGMEVLKQARFGRSQSLLLWGHHIVLLALLPAYYWYMKGDVLLGLLFLCNAAAIPRQMRWYFQMVGMKRRRIWYRLNTMALVVAFAATHIVSILFILHLHCRTQQLSWRDIPCKASQKILVAGAVTVLVNLYWLQILLKDSPRPRASHKST